MKKKTFYTLLLICFSLAASSHKNTNCTEEPCNKLCKARSLEGNTGGAGEAKEADSDIPAATGFLPGYSILLSN